MTIRICVLGASNVGKTQLVNRIVNNSFSPVYVRTTEKEVYRVLYETDLESGADLEQYRMVEIHDMSPVDH
jgi:GTPase SAR1 family protein